MAAAEAVAEVMVVAVAVAEVPAADGKQKNVNQDKNLDLRFIFCPLLFFLIKFGKASFR